MNVYGFYCEEAIDPENGAVARLSVRLATSEDKAFTESADVVFITIKLGFSEMHVAEALRLLADALEAKALREKADALVPA